MEIDCNSSDFIIYMSEVVDFPIITIEVGVFDECCIDE